MKKVALVLLTLVMSSLCFVKATAQTSKSDTTKKKKPAGVAKESDNSPVSKSYYVNTYNAWQAAEALLMFRNKRIQEMQADSIAYVDSLIKLGVELSNNNDEIADLEDKLDSMKDLVVSYSNFMGQTAPGGTDLTVPLINYTAECNKPGKCTDLKTLLMSYPTEEEVTSGDAEALQKIYEFNEAIDRLTPKTVGMYYGALMAQKDQMLNGSADKKARRAYKKKLYAIEATLAELQKRKDFILSRKEYWSQYGESKKLVMDLFLQVKGHEMK